MDESLVVTTTVAAAVLVSWWKPLLLLAAFGGWAWVVSSVFDKDAARFYLPREKYNTVHLLVGLVALVVAVGIPGAPWFAVIPGAILILVLHPLVYVTVRNKDERVPDAFRWSLNPAAWVGALKEKGPKKRKETKGITMTFVGPNGRLASPEADTPEYEVRVALEETLREMIDKRGSRLDVVPVKEGVYGVVTTVDGVKTPLKQLSAQDASAQIDLLKRAAGLPVEERRKKLRGEVKMGVGDSATTDAWVTASGSSQGMRLSLLLNPSTRVDFKIEDLGLSEKQRQELDELVSDSSGVVLLTAPPGGGRTSLLYAMVRAHDAYTQNIQILELDTQRVIEGVRHNVFDPAETGGEFATTARSILRRDPDVAGIAEMPDKETAATVARADVEHTRVYLSLTQSDPLAAVQAYLQGVGDASLAAESLRGVVACRLLRKLCQNCRIAYKPTDEMLGKLGLKQVKQPFYRTEGKVMVKDQPETCPVCGGTGYVGQVAAFAVHRFTDEDRAALVRGDLQSVRAGWRQRGQASLQTSALQLVMKGETTVDELLRVMQGSKSSKKSSKKPSDAESAKA